MEPIKSTEVLSYLIPILKLYAIFHIKHKKLFLLPNPSCLYLGL